MHRFARFLLAIAVVPWAIACGEPIRLPAQDAVFTDTLTVYAITGTPVSFPTALNLGQLVAVRASGVFDFEIAFDINAAGDAVLLPMSLVAQSEIGIRRIGILEVDSTFEQVTFAPRTGYVYDEPIVLEENGDVVVIESQIGCQPPYPQLIFSKLVVDSVKPAERAIYLRATTDPSCGFRSFLPGLPRN